MVSMVTTDDDFGFGLAFLRGEGMPIHPDELENQEAMTDAQYLRQLQAYKDAYCMSIKDMRFCARDRLLKDLK
jgi:hypothetical protein